MTTVIINGPRGSGKSNILVEKFALKTPSKFSDKNESYIITDTYESLLKLKLLIGDKIKENINIMTIRKFLKSKYHEIPREKEEFFTPEEVSILLYNECIYEHNTHADTVEITNFLKESDCEKNQSHVDLTSEINSNRNSLYYSYLKALPGIKIPTRKSICSSKDLKTVNKLAATYIGKKFTEKKQSLSLIDYNDILSELISFKSKSINRIAVYNYHNLNQMEIHALRAICSENCDVQFYGDKYLKSSQNIRCERLISWLWKPEKVINIKIKTNSCTIKISDLLIENYLDVFSEKSYEFTYESPKKIEENIYEISLGNSERLLEPEKNHIYQSIDKNESLAIVFGSKNDSVKYHAQLKKNGIKAVNHFYDTDDPLTRTIQSVILLPIVDYNWFHIFNIVDSLSLNFGKTSEKIIFSIALEKNIKHSNSKSIYLNFFDNKEKIYLAEIITQAIILDYKKLDSAEEFIKELKKFIENIKLEFNISDSEVEFDLNNFQTSLFNYLSNSELGLKNSINKFCKDYIFGSKSKCTVNLVNFNNITKNRYDTVIAHLTSPSFDYLRSSNSKIYKEYHRDTYYYEQHHVPFQSLDEKPATYQRLYNLTGGAKNKLVLVNQGFSSISKYFASVPILEL